MKKILNIILVLIMVCCPMLNVYADNVCTYEKDLKISYDKNGSLTVDVDFWKGYEKILKFVELFNEGKTVFENDDLETQIDMLSGLCPSKVFYCKSVSVGFVPINTEFDLTVPVELLNNFKKGAGKEALFDIIRHYIFQGLYINTSEYLGATEEDFKKSKIYSKIEETQKKANKIEGETSGSTMYAGNYLIDTIYNVINNEASVEEAVGLIAAKIIPAIALTAITGGQPFVFVSTVGLTLLSTMNANYLECGYLNYTGTGLTYNLACASTGQYLKEYYNILSNLGECKGDASCRSRSIKKLKMVEDKTKKYCNNILENYDYGKNEDGTLDLQGECIEGCFEIADTMNMMKENAGIAGSNLGECGFSARLLSWGRNIVKWVKYIVPVVLIILGILDFIRAITKDKEEEMKKAQSRFIKRLIAAALIFIIPFILGFVLDKMGFGDYIESCNLIEELNDYNGKD